MKFTRDWLFDHLDIDRPLDEILDALPMLGLEVESFDDPSERLAPFTVAEVISAEQHPDAGRQHPRPGLERHALLGARDDDLGRA